MQTVKADDDRYLVPAQFTSYDFAHRGAKMYAMTKVKSEVVADVNENLRIEVIQDSIWSYQDELDIIGIGILPNVFGSFFKKKPKVVNMCKGQAAFFYESIGI